MTPKPYRRRPVAPTMPTPCGHGLHLSKMRLLYLVDADMQPIGEGPDVLLFECTKCGAVWNGEDA